MRHVPGLLLPIILFLSILGAAQAQERDSLRYYRIYLTDKGTPARVLLPTDPMYDAATRHLTERAMKRRARVLPADRLVTTDDLPLYTPYLETITENGGHILQTSRWFNSVMVLADSITYNAITTLPFVDSVQITRTRTTVPTPFIKPSNTGSSIDPSFRTACITEQYGLADFQNRQIGIDYAHERGFAGEGVLIGILDAGFDWRSHVSLRDAQVLAEYDFVNNDSLTYNTPEEEPSNPEYHGTAVMSIIAGYDPGVFVGGAPRARFLLAKTEDVRSEHHVEEDNLVAGLEWLEAQGVDVTNTSLGYTDFDAPERLHPHEELDGHTAFASRGVNRAVRLGVTCVVSAGNEHRFYRYHSVPAEADSAIAVAAVDSAGVIAPFSGRGIGSRADVKPNVSALGVGDYAALPTDSTAYYYGNGTSFAAPLVTAAAAIILSARPELTPYQLRTLLQETADRADNPDTAYGYGLISVQKALEQLSRTAPIVGYPKLMLHDGHLALVTWIGSNGTETQPISSSTTLTLELRTVDGDVSSVVRTPQPSEGIARWYVPAEIGGRALQPGDRLEISIRSDINDEVLRKAEIELTEDLGLPVGTLCTLPTVPRHLVSTSIPNPFSELAYIRYEVDREEPVTLAIYNAVGEHVATLVDNEMVGIGYHIATFAPDDLPAGAYYYALIIGEQIATDQLLYLPE